MDPQEILRREFDPSVRRIVERWRQNMTTPEQTRTELLAALADLGRARPEWRLGQTLANLAMTADRLDPGGVWDMEDEEALAATRVLLSQCAKTERAIA
jgi:hypothetical protein